MDTAWLGCATSTFLLFARTSGCGAMVTHCTASRCALQDIGESRYYGNRWVWDKRPSVFAGVEVKCAPICDSLCASRM